MTVYDYDLEFDEDGDTIELISIAIVADDGRELYAINWDADLDRVRDNAWLMANVVPTLPLTLGPDRWGTERLAWDFDKPDADKVLSPKRTIASAVEDFLLDVEHRDRTGMLPHVELWADYGAYDHVALAQLWGRMIDLPEGIPMFTHDIQQEASRLGIAWDALPKQESGMHNALADARHNQVVRRWLAEQAV